MLKWLQEPTETTELLIEQLLDIGVALSDTYDLGELLNLILSKSREITCSDAGSIYLVDEVDNKQKKLLFKAAQNDSFPELAFQELRLAMTDESLTGYVALTGQTLNLLDVYNLPDLPYPMSLDLYGRLCSLITMFIVWFHCYDISKSGVNRQ